MAVTARHPILSHQQVRWLRDIMRDCDCPRIQREAMERHNDGERLLEAAAAMGQTEGYLRVMLETCRANLSRLHSDVDEVLESAAVAFAAAMRHQGKSGGSKDAEETPLRPEAAQVLESWEEWLWRAEWN